MCKFYFPDGTGCSFYDFINYYSKMYFYFNDRNEENDILCVLKRGLTYKPDFEDIKKILEWKTGRKANEKGIIQTQYGINISDVISNFPGENDIDSFAKMKVSGIGPVYKIALLFFATKGEYPIYDQFADLGLRAIRENAEPQKIKFKYKDLTDNFKARYTQYIEYLDKLSKEYSIQYKGSTDECRKLDRALWVYGHMFKEKEK